MSAGDWIVLGCIAVCAVLAVLFLRRQRKRGTTCSGCCGGCCKACKKEKE